MKSTTVLRVILISVSLMAVHVDAAIPPETNSTKSFEKKVQSSEHVQYSSTDLPTAKHGISIQTSILQHTQDMKTGDVPVTSILGTSSTTLLSSSSSFPKIIQPTTTLSDVTMSTLHFSFASLSYAQPQVTQTLKFEMYSTAFTGHNNMTETVMSTKTLEAYIWSTLSDIHSALEKNGSTFLWSHSTEISQPSSTTQIAKTSLPKSALMITSSAEIMSATSDGVPTESQKPITDTEEKTKTNSPDEMTTGSKIAIGVVVSVFVVGVITAAVVVYMRHSITHRSLKSFLTSGVRYKTYKNATYKDDEVVADIGIVSELT